MVKRCSWCTADPEYVKYHDEEWGVAVHDDVKLFEMLILEGAQAGLSWLTVLKKRNNYRRAFDNFDFTKVAKYDDSKIEELIKDSGIIRNRLKIKSAVLNAKVYLEIREEFGSFDKYIWGFVEGKAIVNVVKNYREIPSSTPISDAVSSDLKKRGMNFVGSTIIYAFMQAVGMVDDHEENCFKKLKT